MVRIPLSRARILRVPFRRPAALVLVGFAVAPLLGPRPRPVHAQTLREPTGKIRRPLNFTGTIGAVTSGEHFDLVLDRSIRVRLSREGSHDRDPAVELPAGSTQHVLMATGMPEGVVTGRRARVLGFWDQGVIHGRAIEFDTDPEPAFKPGTGAKRRPLP